MHRTAHSISPSSKKQLDKLTRILYTEITTKGKEPQMPRQNNTPSELDAYNRLILAENAMDKAVAEAEAYEATINHTLSRETFGAALGAALGGDPYSYPSGMIEAEQHQMERLLRPVRNAAKDVRRYRVKAGSLA